MLFKQQSASAFAFVSLAARLWNLASLSLVFTFLKSSSCSSSTKPMWKSISLILWICSQSYSSISRLTLNSCIINCFLTSSLMGVSENNRDTACIWLLFYLLVMDCGWGEGRMGLLLEFKAASEQSKSETVWLGFSDALSCLNSFFLENSDACSLDVMLNIFLVSHNRNNLFSWLTPLLFFRQCWHC